MSKTYEQYEHIRKHSKIPVDEHKMLADALELIKNKLWKKTNYQSKVEIKDEIYLIKKIGQLQSLLDHEFNREYGNTIPNVYNGGTFIIM
jgi:hypothetical protein